MLCVTRYLLHFWFRQAPDIMGYWTAPAATSRADEPSTTCGGLCRQEVGCGSLSACAHHSLLSHVCVHVRVVVRYSQVLSGARRSTPAGIVDFVPVGYDLELVEVRCSFSQARSDRRAS